MTAGWRYLLFELNGNGTETFVKGGVALGGVSATRVLSGPHQITGTIAVPERDLVREDGSPMVRRWKSTLYIEDSNRAIWTGGIVVDFNTEGAALKLDVSGFTTQIKGMPYDSELKGTQIDPMTVVKEFWQHAQQKPGGNLGLDVQTIETPVRIGELPERINITPSEISRAAETIAGRIANLQPLGNDLLWEGAPDEVKTHAPTFLAGFTGNKNPLDRVAMFGWLGQWTTIPQKLNAAQDIRDRLRSGDPIAEDWTWTDAPDYVGVHNDFLLAAYGGNSRDVASATAWLDRYIEQNIDRTASTPPKNTLQYAWWSTDDMGGVIDQLAKDTPFDYLEEHSWDGAVIRHRLRFGYPRIGTRRTEPRFVLAENVTIIPTEDYSGEDVVTEVWVLGSGEGRARVRAVASTTPRDSLCRVKIIDDPEIQDYAAAEQRARDELSYYQPDVPGAGVTSLRVKNHSNAPFGSYEVGDEVMYSGRHEWGNVALWVRIVSMTVNPDDGDDVVLSVVRADTLKA